jgi:predicted CopG family antitoxin
MQNKGDCTLKTIQVPDELHAALKEIKNKSHAKTLWQVIDTIIKRRQKK